LPSKEIEDRIMSERRPQPMPPTPPNPTLESTEPLMYTGETMDDFYARRKPLEALWNQFMAANASGAVKWELRA
jgi:hypothetical protein